MNLISRSIIATCLSFQIGLAEEQPERPPRSVKELVASLEMAGQKIYSEGLRGKDEISYQQKILANWSGPEINLVLNQLEGDRLGGVHYWKEPLIEQSAYLDEEPECIIVLGFNSVIGTDLDKSHHASGRYSAEMEVRSYYDYLESVIKGWSRRDPKAAWAAINKPNGRLSRSVLLKEYGHHLCKHIFVHLSKVDHEFALAELFKHPDRLYRRSMLKGMSRGLPSGLDWRKFYESIVKTIKEKKWDPIITLRDRILARWMQDDHKAAIAWFHSKVGEAISLMEVEVYDDENPSKPIGVKKERVSLRFAIRHWLANDKEGATAWLKDHPEMIEEILEKGAWVDPDSLTKGDLREMLVGTLSQQDRNALLLKLVKNKTAGRVLSELNTFPEKPTEEDFAVIKREIAELKVSPAVSAKLLAFREAHPDWSDPIGD